MKRKNLGVCLTITFLIIVLMNLISAATFTISPTTLVFDQNTNSRTFIITNLNDSELLSVTITSPFTLDGLVFDITGNMSNINSSQPRTLTITSRSTNDFSSIDFGSDISGNLMIINEQDSSDNLTLAITAENKDFCRYSNPGELSVSIGDINVKSGFGD